MVNERIEELEEALGIAVDIIESYEGDIRAAGLSRYGFCQGETYRNAIPHLLYLLNNGKKRLHNEQWWEEGLEEEEEEHSKYCMCYGCHIGKFIFLPVDGEEETAEENLCMECDNLGYLGCFCKNKN